MIYQNMMHRFNIFINQYYKLLIDHDLYTPQMANNVFGLSNDEARRIWDFNRNMYINYSHIPMLEAVPFIEEIKNIENIFLYKID